MGCNVAGSRPTTHSIPEGPAILWKGDSIGSKTLYVGGIYEVDKASGGSVTRTVTYYPVAGAMRVDGTLYYMLKDHLGSASVLTNATGNAVSGADVRYYPFGEARSSTSSMLTDKLFTGQREMAGLGIYHYQARFYLPKLGSFLSPDSIIPGAGNPQAYNRYSYVLNNPLNYIDPSGHDPHWCEGNDSCLYNWLDGNSQGDAKDKLFEKYGVTVDKRFNRAEKRAIMAGIYKVGAKFASKRGREETASQAFIAILDGGVNFTLGSDNASGDCLIVASGGCTSSSSQINFWSMAGNGNEFIMQGNVIHELGHAYNNQLGKGPEKDMPNWMPGNRGLFLQPNSLTPRPASQACDDCEFWQFNRALTATETFADMFVAWTYGGWNTSGNIQNVVAVNAAQVWMNNWLP